MNLTSREADLRTAAYEGMTGPDSQNVSDLYVAESDNGLMAEVHSGTNRFGRMCDIVAGVLRGLTSEGESVHVLYVSDSRLARINSDSEGFESKTEAQQRLHVAHSLRLGES